MKKIEHPNDSAITQHNGLEEKIKEFKHRINLCFDMLNEGINEHSAECKPGTFLTIEEIEKKAEEKKKLTNIFKGISDYFNYILETLKAWSKLHKDNNIYSHYGEKLLCCLEVLYDGLKEDPYSNKCDLKIFVDLNELAQTFEKNLSTWNDAFHAETFYRSRKKSWFKLDGPKTYPLYFTLSIAASAVAAIVIGVFAGPVVGAILGTILGLYVYIKVQTEAVKKQDADMKKLQNDMNKNINGVIAASKQLGNISLFKDPSHQPLKGSFNGHESLQHNIKN